MLLTLLLAATSLPPAMAGDVLVVSSADDPGGEPRVLEMYDFDLGAWHAVEKAGSSSAVSEEGGGDEDGDRLRGEDLIRRRPGTARLIEDNSVLQYGLRDGAAVRLASYPASIVGAATLEYGDTFCLVGGYNGGERTLRKSVLCWNPLTPRAVEAAGIDKVEDGEKGTGGWVALPDMTVGRHMPGAVVMDGKLYVAGGYDSDEHKFLSSVEVFDDVSQKWYPVAPLRHARSGLQLVAAGGALYAAGGWRERRHLDVVERYDPLLDEWRTVAPMTEARAKFGAVRRKGKIYAVGGTRGFRPGDQLGSVEEYDPEEDRWEMLESGLEVIRGPARATIVKDE